MMKNFQDNIDTHALEQTSTNRFSMRDPSPRTMVHRVWRWLSRYSLLLVVGLAALAITILHFQGQQLWQTLRGTPLPVFWLEDVGSPPTLPPKTEVYQSLLLEEEKATYRKPSQFSSSLSRKTDYHHLTFRDTTIVDTAAEDSIINSSDRLVPRTKPRTARRKPATKRKAEGHLPTAQVSLPRPSLFQTVRVESTEPTVQFIACVVHGDQEVNNQTRLVLRLTENMTIQGTTVTAGMLIYGTTRLIQQRVQVNISRIDRFPVAYQVYDHTYQAGLWLERYEKGNRLTNIAQESLLREGQGQIGKFPLPVAATLGRSLLRSRSRNHPSVFLPDGFPVYIAAPESIQ